MSLAPASLIDHRKDAVGALEPDAQDIPRTEVALGMIETLTKG
jgi:hypothetical protein